MGKLQKSFWREDNSSPDQEDNTVDPYYFSHSKVLAFKYIFNFLPQVKIWDCSECESIQFCRQQIESGLIGMG